MENGTYRWTPGDGDEKKSSGKKFSGKQIGRLLAVAAVVVLVFAIGSTCWYTVDDKHQAVVTTFGKVTDITGAGVHFKLPFGIQKAQKVAVNVYQKIELGYRTDTSAPEGYDVVEDEGKMITGDYNIVNVDFFVEYKVSNPERYLYGSYEPEEVLRNLIQSQIRNVVGSTQVDAVLTDGKEEIQMQVKSLVTEVLQEYDIGLTLVDVKIQDAEPPTQEVIEAFTAFPRAGGGARIPLPVHRKCRDPQAYPVDRGGRHHGGGDGLFDRARGRPLRVCEPGRQGARDCRQPGGKQRGGARLCADQREAERAGRL